MQTRLKRLINCFAQVNLTLWRSSVKNIHYKSGQLTANCLEDVAFVVSSHSHQSQTTHHKHTPDNESTRRHLIKTLAAMNGGQAPTVDPAVSLACPHNTTLTPTGAIGNPSHKDDPIGAAEGCWEGLQNQCAQNPHNKAFRVQTAICYI